MKYTCKGKGFRVLPLRRIDMVHRTSRHCPEVVVATINEKRRRAAHLADDRSTEKSPGRIIQ